MYVDHSCRFRELFHDAWIRNSSTHQTQLFFLYKFSTFTLFLTFHIQITKGFLGLYIVHFAYSHIVFPPSTWALDHGTRRGAHGSGNIRKPPPALSTWGKLLVRPPFSYHLALSSSDFLSSVGTISCLHAYYILGARQHLLFYFIIVVFCIVNMSAQHIIRALYLNLTFILLYTPY